MSYNKYGLSYQGCKSALADDLLSVLPDAENFYDLFAGGCSMTHAAILSGKYKNVYTNDVKDMPLVFKAAVEGFDYEKYVRPVSKEEFNTTDDYLLKYIFSFSTNFKDYVFSDKNKKLYDILIKFVKNPLDNVKKLKGEGSTGATEPLSNINKLKHRFNCIDSSKLNITKLDYKDVVIKPDSVVYCDIPYQGKLILIIKSFMNGLKK